MVLLERARLARDTPKSLDPSERCEDARKRRDARDACLGRGRSDEVSVRPCTAPERGVDDHVDLAVADQVDDAPAALGDLGDARRRYPGAFEPPRRAFR